MHGVLSRMTIMQRIIAGFGGVILLLLLSSGVSVISLVWINKDFATFEDMAGDALLVSEINADMAKTLIYTRAYLSSRSQDDLATTNRFFLETEEGLAEARGEIFKPERAEAVAEMSEALPHFRQGLDRIRRTRPSCERGAQRRRSGCPQADHGDCRWGVQRRRLRDHGSRGQGPAGIAARPALCAEVPDVQ